MADQPRSIRVVRQAGASPAQEVFQMLALALPAHKLPVLEVVNGGVEDLQIHDHTTCYSWLCHGGHNLDANDHKNLDLCYKTCP